MPRTDLLHASWYQERLYYPVRRYSCLIKPQPNQWCPRIIADVVNTAMTIVGVQLIDRVGRRRLLLIGALGMCCSEFIVAIVGVTVGTPHETASGLAVNITAQRVLIAFTCMYVSLFLEFCCGSEELMVLQLHRVLRYIMGTSHLGAHGRDLRTCISCGASCRFLMSVCAIASRNPCQGHVALRREQLAVELRHRLRHPLPRR